MPPALSIARVVCGRGRHSLSCLQLRSALGNDTRVCECGAIIRAAATRAREVVVEAAAAGHLLAPALETPRLFERLLQQRAVPLMAR